MSNSLRRLTAIAQDTVPFYRNLSVREARDMLVSTLRWRDSFKMDSILTEQFPEKVFGNVGFIHGRDKEGRPVVYAPSENFFTLRG